MGIDAEKVLRLRAAGLTVREIASAMGCSHGRVQQITAAAEHLSPIPDFEVTAHEAKTLSVKVHGPADQAALIGTLIKAAADRARRKIA